MKENAFQFPIPPMAPPQKHHMREVWVGGGILQNGKSAAIMRLIMESTGGFLRKEELRPLRSFGEDYPESRRFFLYRGTERLLREGILCLPCETFLSSLLPDQFPG